MINDEQLNELKSYLTSYVNSITQPDRKAGRNMYICPLCKSGTHRNKGKSNGAFSIYDDGIHWKCFSCEDGGDIFNLIGLYEKIDNFTDQAARAAEFAGIYIENTDTDNYQAKKRPEVYMSNDSKYSPVISWDKEYTAASISKPEEAIQEEKQNTEGLYKEKIERWHKDVDKTAYWKNRGFNDSDIDRFMLGYDETDNTVTIPYDKSYDYYIKRKTEEKYFRKPAADEAGTEPIYNKFALYGNKPCFICESPIDAISIMKAGNGTCAAVALGGTGYRKLIDAVKEKRPDSVLIISMDNDDPGRKASEGIAAELSEIGIKYAVASYTEGAYQKCKDANDLLISDQEQFSKDIAANIEKGERIANAERIERLERYNSYNGAERLKGFIERLQKGGESYVSTGFNELDKELDGGFYPGLYIMGAISSLGKTTLLLQLADQIAYLGHDVLYISLEMSADELISKSISRLTYTGCEGKTYLAKTARGITTTERYPSYSKAEKEIIDKAIQSYAVYAKRLYIHEGVGDIGVEKIKDLVKEHVELTGRTPLIFIDYLQILAPYDVRATDKQNTDKAVLELKRLSRDYKTPVIAISSFNRDNYEVEVNMTAFKESGAVEYGSDVLIAIQPQGMLPGYSNEEKKKNSQLVRECKASRERSLEIVILKQRSGKAYSKVNFNYHTLFNCFSPVAANEKAADEDDGFIPYGAKRFY